MEAYGLVVKLWLLELTTPLFTASQSDVLSSSYRLFLGR
jgi:hypothetical protein